MYFDESHFETYNLPLCGNDQLARVLVHGRYVRRLGASPASSHLCDALLHAAIFASSTARSSSTRLRRHVTMRFYTLMPIMAAMATAAEEPSTTTHAPACTATSSSGSGAFFDLRPDTAVHPDKGKSHKNVVTKDYHSKGYDYGKNFTLNICGPVVDPVMDVVGLPKNQWANVSAYYMSHGNIYSIGSVTRFALFSVMYTGGSPCSSKSSKDGRAAALGGAKTQPHEIETVEKSEDKAPVRRKSATISFHCDLNPGNAQAAISFVNTPDECAYFFEARSVHACAHAEPHKPGSVGPGSVFGIILLVAVLVYALGGVFYNRTVTHARGWRQLPNYSLWSGIWNFISDMCTILCSSCTRCLPSRRGYSALNSNAHSRNRNSDAENRLIDQLDEEWDD
ncbi:mannose-6-phosphate receptor, binding protein [Purpureocillium lavendulum]|uniref:Mannose-6-phosphate receptor, binding protein n=1 Tax=Purpureocillium lavendulum TaxID=1247861 RepID=A0AB34G5I5_9HYPO|nr:mannose-6-phosphate receptor, binding protein [Purpureocillium lavendulum]